MVRRRGAVCPGHSAVGDPGPDRARVVAGSKVHRVPIAGDSLAGPFNNAADAARGMADAGREQQQIVHDLGWVLALLLLAVPVAVVLLGWLPLRVRWIRRARAASALRS